MSEVENNRSHRIQARFPLPSGGLDLAQSVNDVEEGATARIFGVFLLATSSERLTRRRHPPQTIFPRLNLLRCQRLYRLAHDWMVEIRAVNLKRRLVDIDGNTDAAVPSGSFCESTDPAKELDAFQLSTQSRLPDNCFNWERSCRLTESSLHSRMALRSARLASVISPAS